MDGQLNQTKPRRTAGYFIVFHQMRWLLTVKLCDWMTRSVKWKGDEEYHERTGSG